ncbi:MAG: hypothetical protein R3F49_05945 [Planctomycetota bacterium]
MAHPDEHPEVELPASLTRPELEPFLAELAALPEPLARAAAARRALGPELGRRAAELVSLRLRARTRFPAGDLPHLLAKGLEQASRPAVAAARAARLAAALAERAGGDPACPCAGAPAIDPTAGLGSDALALARAGFEVHIGDRALAPCCARARTSRRAASRRARPSRRTRALPWAPRVLAEAALVLDPDRRPDGAREGDPARWSPTLAECLQLAQRAAAACIKGAPAVDPEALQLTPGAVEASWISHGGELVEVAIWTGAAARRGVTREAIVLGEGAPGAAPVVARGEPVDVAPLHPDEVLCLPWLVEPDPAVIRAGLIGAVARDAALRPLAAKIAYLGGQRPGPPGLTRSWPVLGAAPLDRKRVRRLLGDLDIGPITVKKRGHSDPAEVLARRFAGPGQQRGLIAVVRLDTGHIALVLGPEAAGLAG